ncbi:MAG: hypothetical protein E5X67_21390 [Mesorhizobium sp.]|uniref:hypothetical protein n=1 Tax=Mesorhizobium sp. TaxID=1871066 RepID=UPI0011FC4283|nr:hypothetical protein [Mesorhizobium sp.]TIP26220.1 MAG: hypothetical protein E5X67_21390 [Mesorhizobium sp.]
MRPADRSQAKLAIDHHIGRRLLYVLRKTTFKLREAVVGVEKFIEESPKVTLRTACRGFDGPTQQFVAHPGAQVFR